MRLGLSMAHISSEPVGKISAEAAVGDDAINAARADTEGQPAPIEYDVERVEKVYRKLDLRIIPGKQEPRPI